MTAEELLRRYAAGERDFTGTNLQGVELKYAQLSGINLSRVVLYDARLFRIDLSGANLSEARLSDTTIEDVDLSNAIFSGADLGHSTIRRSSLEGASFENACLAETGMEDSWLNRANFQGAFFGETHFTRCAFSDAIIDINELRGCYLTQTSLPDGEIVTNVIQD